MDIKNARQLRYVSDSKNAVSLVIETPTSVFPFIASSNDNDVFSDIYDRAIAGEWGDIEPPDGYVEQNGVLVMLPEFAAAQFEQAKQDAKQSVLNFAELARQTLAGNPTALEAAAWSAKEARARRVVNDASTELDQHIVQIECEERGLNETVTQLAKLQLSKSDQLLTAVSIIDGMTKAALTAVDTVATAEDLNALIVQLKADGERRLQQLKGG